MAQLKIGFLGAGKMATALARGFLNAGLVKANQLVAADPYEAARKQRAARVAERSERSGKHYHMAGALRVARNLMLRYRPGERLLGRFDWLYGESNEVALD